MFFYSPINSKSGARTGGFRRHRNWAVVTLLVTAISGCGGGGSSGSGDSSGAGGDSAAGGGGTGGIMVTPAAGGGIVVGDPLSGGSAAPARKSRSETDVDASAAATVPAATPAVTPAAAPAEAPPARQAPFVLAKGDDEKGGSPSRATDGVEPGDEPPPADAAAPAPSAAPAGDGVENPLANPRGFLTKRQEAEANSAFPPGTVGPEDVDAPPANALGGNAALERGPGLGRQADVDQVSGIGAGAANPNVEVKRGSADEVTETFLTLVAAGEIEKAQPLIAGRATGLLARLRDGTATQEQIDELKELAAIRQPESSRPKGGTHRLITFRADKKMLVVEAEQKEADCCVLKLDIRTAPRRRK